MLLVIDTCFNACSVALFDTHVIASRYDEMERGHAEALGPMVEAVFAECGLKPSALTRVAVTVGPGTFTGLRIGLAYAKGLALALGVPLISLDSLTATAAPHFGGTGVIAVVQKAGGTGHYYCASYAAEHGAPIAPPQFATASVVQQTLATGGCHVVGTGAGDFAQYPALTPALPAAALFAPYASGLAPSAASVLPLYLRAPDAKRSTAAETIVRKATAEDFAIMAEIHALCFAQGWTVDALKSLLAVPGADALVVELAGNIYGFVQYQVVLDEAEINTLCVSPSHQRQRFGSDLLSGLFAELALRQVSRVFLDVADNNAAALALYTSSGFQRTGLRKAYYADGHDAVLMQRTLAQ